MEYIYYLEGLGCANCAAKMEAGISKHRDVKSANVVFMKKKLIIEPKVEMTDKLLEEITEIVIGIEDHVKIVPFSQKDKYADGEGMHNHHHNTCCDGEGHHHGQDTCCDEEEHHHDQDTCCDREEHDHHHDACYEEEDHHHSHESIGSAKADIICTTAGVAMFATAFILEKIDLVPAGIYIPAFVIAYILVGYDVLWQSLKHICKGQVFDEFFLMSAATVGALLVGEYPEAVAVMIFYKIGEYFQDKAVDQARGSIEALVNIKPDFANVVLADGTVVKKAPSAVTIGDVIEVKAGERIPLDGELIEGSTSLDMAALTGETKPVDVAVGDRILSGSINVTGYIRMKVLKTFGDSTVARIMDMVENAADKKSRTEQFITKFARIYTPIVCFLALALAVLPPLISGGEWSAWIYRALSFLVVSCPCALVISVPLGFFGGIGVASKNGILVKGGNYLEALADVSIIAFDKTGTLTKGSFRVSQIHVDEVGIHDVAARINEKALDQSGKFANMDTEQMLLYLLSLVELKSNHPIGKSVLAAWGNEISADEIVSYEEVAGYGLCVDTIYGRILAGNEKMMQKHGINYEKETSPATIVYGAFENIFIGAVVISDEIKADAKEGIQALAGQGVGHTVLLSGDSNELVKEVADEIGIETAFGELLPGDKLEKMEQIYEENPDAKVAYVGDGINDAPVLARVDVGIAMGGVGQDAAIESADMVLMTDEIGKLAKAVSIAKYTRQIVTENILLALGIKVLVLILIAAGFSSMWMAVFADVGVALLAVCNSIRVYKHNFLK